MPRLLLSVCTLEGSTCGGSSSLIDFPSSIFPQNLTSKNCVTGCDYKKKQQEFTFPRLCLSDVGGHLVEAQTGKIDLEK